MTDRFDTPLRLKRVGVHRAPETRWWRWWMTLVVAAAACVLLTATGVYAISTVRGEGIPVPTLDAQTEPLTDPSQLPEGTTITVLGAAGDEASAVTAESRIAGAGWPVAARVQAEDARDSTVIYYVGDELEAAALGIAASLGFGTIVPVDEPVAGASIAVALGTDAATALTGSTP